METAMDDKKPDAKTIAEEAVGETRGAPIPDAVKDKPEMPTEEIIRQLATSAGPQAGMANKTAEALGERAGDAYADGTMDEATGQSRNIARPARSRARRAAQQPFMAVAAGFGLGFAAALLIHRRQ
jgi:ElaB/YqjD/DUF883 family membrane-anchored ribosome-binding protein